MAARPRGRFQDPAELRLQARAIVVLALAAVALTKPLTETITAVAPQGNVTDSACEKKCPCCTPQIDQKASVIESYKKHRAHAALIGDYGDCGVTNSGYDWEVDWGDGDAYKKHIAPMGPYQATHTYAKKGKYTVTTKFCTSKPGPKYKDCEFGCSEFSETINVKP